MEYPAKEIPMSNDPVIDRRRFLSGTLGVAALSVAGPTVLAGCNTASTSDTTAATEGVTLPTYQKFTGVKPDLPGNDQGLLDGFLSYPQPPVKVFDAAPGD